jgi:hypothetical protein
MAVTDRFGSNSAAAVALTPPLLWVRVRYGPAGAKRQILSSLVQRFHEATRIRQSIQFAAHAQAHPREKDFLQRMNADER